MTERLHFLSFYISFWRRKWQPTPVFLPGESHGWRGLVGYSLWGCKYMNKTKQITHTHTHTHTHLNGLVVFPTFFNLSLNLAIKSSWSEPQFRPTEIQIHWATDHRSDQFMISTIAAPPSNSQTLSGHWPGSHKFTSVLTLSTWECQVPWAENSVPQDAPTSDANCRSRLSLVPLTNWLQSGIFITPPWVQRIC